MGSGRCAQFCQLHPLPEPESLPLLLLPLLHRALWRPLTGDMGSGRCAQFCQLHPLPEPESLPSWIPSCADLWLSLPFLNEVNRWVAHGVQMPIQQNAQTFDRENKSPSHHLPFVRNEVQRMIQLGVIIIPEKTVHNTAATVMCTPPPPPPPPPFSLLWRRSLEMACQRRTGFRCKRNKGIYYQKFRCNQEGGGRSGNDTRVASTARCNQES